MVLRALLAVAILAGGCGRSAGGGVGAAVADGGPDGPGAAAEGDVAQGCGSFRQSNCSPGSWCNGSSACGSVWQCQGEMPSGCTSGIVGFFCDCGGAVVASDGCPMRYAYGLGSQFGLSATWSGSRCDPTSAERPPFSMSYRIQAQGLEAFEGRPVYFTFVLPPAAEPQLRDLTGRHQAVVKSGGFEWSVRPAGPRADARGAPLHEGYQLNFFVDLDGNGVCTTEADTGGTPSGFRVDLIAMQFQYALAGPLPAPGKPELHICDRFR